MTSKRRNDNKNIKRLQNSPFMDKTDRRFSGSVTKASWH